MILPFYSRYQIESKIHFHSFDNYTKPSIYATAQAVVKEDKVINIEEEK